MAFNNIFEILQVPEILNVIYYLLFLIMRSLFATRITTKNGL